jgi:hypothetical protein
MDQVRGREGGVGERGAHQADPPRAADRDPRPEQGQPGGLDVDGQHRPAAVQQRQRVRALAAAQVDGHPARAGAEPLARRQQHGPRLAA